MVLISTVLEDNKESDRETAGSESDETWSADPNCNKQRACIPPLPTPPLAVNPKYDLEDDGIYAVAAIDDDPPTMVIDQPRDVATSSLAQGCSAQSCLVDIERFDLGLSGSVNFPICVRIGLLSDTDFAALPCHQNVSRALRVVEGD